MDGETRTAIGKVYEHADGIRDAVVSKVDEGFDKVSKKLDRMNEENHKQDLAIQDNHGGLVLCQADMGPKVKAAHEEAEKARKEMTALKKSAWGLVIAVGLVVLRWIMAELPVLLKMIMESGAS